MATATATATATVDPDASPPLRLTSIPAVDLRLLSHSDLLSLSNFSNSNSNFERSEDDVVIPKIDRSVFNESAGSRKQTYSRLRLAPPDTSNSSSIHRRTRRLRGAHNPAFVSDAEHADNAQIVSVLKELFKPDASSFQEEDLGLIGVQNENNGNDVEDTELPNAEEETHASLNTEEVENPALVNTEETPALVNTEETTVLVNTEETTVLVNAEETPALVNTEETPALVNTEETPAMVNTEETPALVNTEETPALVNIEETPASVNAKEPELVVNSEAIELVKTEVKRKRGRPRKDENAVTVRPPEAKRMRSSTVKKVVVYDDEKDREIVNSRGVEVDLRELGGLEDPYGPEIRRRTEGMSTSDELLGFMRGLAGQWGTTRKKRRVVDASDFGDALPKGWRLSLCIKKKEGHVWLFCRRYISPSGRQFESCKDISAYLLSLLGQENLDQIHSTNCDDFALEESCGHAANSDVQEDLKRNSTVHNQSTPPISLPADCEKQSTYGIVGPVDMHADEAFKCLKCFLIFEGKNELFDHQSLSHKDEKPQHSSSLPDWSIVIGGIYDCNICRKTFYEINQYNGHIGTHVTNENKTAEKTVDPVTISAEIVHNMSSVVDFKNVDEVVHDLDMNEDVLVEESGDGIGNKFVNDNIVPETDKAPDVSVSISRSECDIDQDLVGRSNAQDSGSEARVQSSSLCEEKGFQADVNDTRVSGSFDKLTTEQGKSVYSESSSGFFHGTSNGQDDVSEARVHNSSICEEQGFRENINDMHISSSFDELTPEKGKVVNNTSSSGVFHGMSDGRVAVSETRVQTSSICEERGFRENIDDARIFSPYGELTSEKGKVVNKDSSSGVFSNRLRVDEGRLAETKKLSESECLPLFSNTFKRAVDNPSLISSIKQAPFQKVGFASVDQVTHGFDDNKYSYNMSSSKLDEQYEARNSKFDRYEVKEHVNKGYFHIENVDKSGEANLDEFQVYRNNEPVNNKVVSLGGSSQNGLNANVMDFNTGKNIEFSSLVPPGNNQAFGFQDGLKFDDIFGDKFDENIHELSLAFGNPNSLYEDTINVNEQKKDVLNCSSVVSSKINDTFDVQTDLSMVNNSMAQDLKRGNETRCFQNNDISVYSGRTWGDFKSNAFRNPEDKKFMMGSGSNQMWKPAQGNQLQPEDKKFMMGSGSNQMWKPAQGNQLQSGLGNSAAQIQPPNFHSFDIMSQKAQEGLFRHNERYNSSRSEPVEFRFLTDRSEQNPHAHQPGSRVFPQMHNPGIEQGFDSNFWMGKNAMMPNMNARNIVTSVCTWCRAEFHLPAMVMNQRIQAGVGSLCPNCSAGISGQVNML